MNGVDLSNGDIALVCQLVSAAALAVHLLVLRPRAARRDLLLDAQIVQDELELGARLGQVSPIARETLALQQILRRVRHDPRSVGMVMDRITLLSQTPLQRSPQTHVECIRGALDRLGDAGHRYLRGAWPRAGMPAPRPAGRSYGLEEIEDLDDLDDVNTVDDRNRDGTGDVVLDLSSVDHDADDDHEAGVDLALVDLALAEAAEPVKASAPAADPVLSLDAVANDVECSSETGDSSDADSSGEGESDVDTDPAQLRESAASAAEEEAQQIIAAGTGSINVDLSHADQGRATAWVDLVQAENVPPVAGAPDRPPRHSRPFRPGRSSPQPAEKSTEKPAEPVDRSTMLPR